ncbi:MAG TPA: hypothetical protein PKZ18_01735 [Bacteroidales bacterium]|jgi:hypothetical protein|nr:MAG: hypothetical protein BWX77_00769 [Bacteroidetes bacterium ADurb.Bin090]HOQ58019.1 hypothetical protein [Bacteroidales bacterium]HQM92607.1 hypothetical protein [Bacteroidales bacterium]
MKKSQHKTSLFFWTIFFVSYVSTSCITESEYDSSLLIGKWVSGTEYYRYNEDGTGLTWDTADDVTEQEAQAFTWTLVYSTLTHMHILEVGGVVPKVYTVTELTATSLKYEDEFGKTYSFTKSSS